MDQLLIHIDKNLKTKIKIHCAQNNIKIKDFVTDALIKKLDLIKNIQERR